MSASITRLSASATEPARGHPQSKHNLGAALFARISHTGAVGRSTSVYRCSTERLPISEPNSARRIETHFPRPVKSGKAAHGQSRVAAALRPNRSPNLSCLPLASSRSSRCAESPIGVITSAHTRLRRPDETRFAPGLSRSAGKDHKATCSRREPWPGKGTCRV